MLSNRAEDIQKMTTLLEARNMRARKVAKDNKRLERIATKIYAKGYMHTAMSKEKWAAESVSAARALIEALDKEAEK